MLSSPIFPAVMRRDRFQLLLRCLHFSNSDNEPDRSSPDYDRLYKLRPIFESLQQSFQSVYDPDISLSIDEELVLWKGRLQFKQFLPLKRARFGIKIYCLCECSGYMYRFQVYTGKEHENQEVYSAVPDDAKNLTKTERIVVHLMQPLLDKGYQLYTDNFYTSVVCTLT